MDQRGKRSGGKRATRSTRKKKRKSCVPELARMEKGSTLSGGRNKSRGERPHREPEHR